MIVENWITYKKIMCKCSKINEGIKIIYKETKKEIIDTSKLTKDENIERFVNFSKNIIKLVGKDFVKDFVNDKELTIDKMKEKDKILDLIVEYVETGGFPFDISLNKEVLWTIKSIDTFIYQNIFLYLNYEIYTILRRDSLTLKSRNILNTDINVLDLPDLYDIDDLEVISVDYIPDELYNILIDNIFNTINDNKISLHIELISLLSNNFCGRLSSTNLIDLLLYVLLEKYITLNHHYNYTKIENKSYICERCGEEYSINDYDYPYPPNHMKYCEKCRDISQKGYKSDYKEKVKIINELNQYKGKIPKEYNDIRNDYNRIMRLINNRKKGDKLPPLNELGKMLLKLKNLKGI